MVPNNPDYQRRADLFQDEMEVHGIRINERQAMNYALQDRQQLLKSVLSTHPSISMDGLQNLEGIYEQTERRSSFLKKAAIVTLLAGGGLAATYFAAPHIFRLWGGIESNNTKVGLDWFQRFTQTLRSLSPRFGTSAPLGTANGLNTAPPGSG